jgi:hypothetical protein
MTTSPIVTNVGNRVAYNGNKYTKPGIYAGALKFLNDSNIASRNINSLSYPLGYNFNLTYNNPSRSPNYYNNGLFTGYPYVRDPLNVYRSYYLPVSLLYAPYTSPYQLSCSGYANPNDCRSCVAAFGGSPYNAQQICGPHIF